MRNKRPLTDLVPPSATLPPPPVRDMRGVRLDVALPEGYVWPDVEPLGDSVPAGVVLISAPGAMGKTVAAEALSATAGVPHLDLSTVRVGSGTFVGELGRFFGMAAAGTYLEAVARGDAGLVLDGLDEAQLRSGTEHFFAFMEDLAEQMEDAEPRGQIVILGRPDAISGAELVMTNFGVPFVKFELAPLDYSKATQLIDETLDQTTYTGHRDSAIPFAELRDAVLADLGAALTGRGTFDASTDWPAVAAILGYPPVLEAISARLAVNNPKAEFERVKADPTKSDMTRGELLVHVSQRVLDRECDKVRANLPDAIGLAEDDPIVRSLYTREEQIVRLIARIGNLSIDPIPPVVLNATAKAAYEAQVSGFLADHPFAREGRFANVVFADYCHAFIATSPTIETYGVSTDRMSAACPDVGPFFAHFVHALSSRGEHEALIKEDVVDDVLRSFQVEDRPDRSATYVERAGEAVLALSYTGEEIDGNGNSSAPDMLLFSVEDLSGAIELSTPLARCVVASDSGVVLRSSGGLCELGPSVIVSASAIEIRGERLVALGPRHDQATGVLLASREWINSGRLEISARPNGALSVITPQSAYPWQAFAVQFDKSSGVPPEQLYEAIVTARRILSCFGRSIGAAPARNVDFVERIVVGQHEMGSRVLKGLVDEGVIVRETSLYRLDLSVLGEHGINYAALKDARFEEALAPLVTKILRSEE